MNERTIIILSVLVAFSLINTSFAASPKDEANKILIIGDPVTNTAVLKIELESAKPDLVTMEEVYKITSYEDYTFNNTKDFIINWENFKGNSDIINTKWEILETTNYSVTVPDFEFNDINEHIVNRQEIRYLDEWKPFFPDGITIKKNEVYLIKLTLYKRAEVGNVSIKTIIRFDGIDDVLMTWWNTTWDYRIDNTISDGVRPYQFSLNLMNTIGLNNNRTHVFLNGHSNINFTDIRFTLNNTNALSYWIEKETGRIWVNVTANGTVNLYYGNPSAIDSSDGDKTFEFFDDFEPRSWQKLQKLPEPRADQAGAVLDGKIYTIGGYDTSHQEPSASVWAYDPGTNSYLQKADLTYARWGQACTSHDSNIYCFGGTPKHITEKYDPAINNWETLSNQPAPLQDQGLAAVAGDAYIYLFRSSILYKYNPIDDSYINLTLFGGASPETVINWPSMAFYNNEIYIIGGVYNDRGVNYVQIYNLTNNEWRNGAPMPIGLYGSLRENPIINNKIYILQGQGIWNNYNFHSRFWVYNIITNSWDWGELGYWDADGVSGGVIGTKIYTFGGRRGHNIDDRGTDFAGVLDTTKNMQNKWIDVKSGSWREDNSSLTNGLGQRYPIVQIRTAEPVFNVNNKIISRIKYSSGSSGYGGLILQSNGGVYGSNNYGYLDPFINIAADRDELRKQSGDSTDLLLGARSLALPDVWHTYISYYYSSSIRSTRDGTYDILAPIGTFKDGYIQVFKSVGFDQLIDYIAVARSAKPEPSWATWGEEYSNSNTPEITSWNNNKLNNNSLNLTVNVSEAVSFNATASQTIIEWIWSKDDMAQNNNFDNFTTSWPREGIKTIKVKTTSSNGNSNIITWNINVVSSHNKDTTKEDGAITLGALIIIIILFIILIEIYLSK